MPNLLTNLALCPHSVLMFFVWFSHQTSIFLNTTDLLVVVIELQCVSCEVRTAEFRTLIILKNFTPQALPWIRWSVAGISPRSPGFDPRPTAVHKLTMGQPFLWVLWLSVVGIIPPIVHIHSRLNTLTSIISGTSGRSLRTLGGYRGIMNTEVLSHSQFDTSNG